MSRIALKLAKFACCLAAVVLPLVHVEIRAEVIISEIMYDPQNTDTNREWVELFNTGTSAVSLNGWQFGLPSNNLWTTAFSASVSIGAGQALVLTPSSATLDS